MARSAVRTLLPLDRFARIVGLNPLHFNQVAVTASEAATCGAILFQESWQNADHMGRDEVAHAIAEAEGNLARQLGYKLLPTWEVAESLNFKSNKPYRNPMWMAPDYGLNWGNIISGGVEAKLVIQAGAAIVYTDVDSDGYSETATIIVATTVTDAEEIAIYYPSQSGSDDWEIRPITVSISGGTATIIARREQFVLANLLTRLAPEEVEGTDNASFLTTVDVYRHYNDPQTQIQFMWEGGCNCGDSSCYACTYEVQTGCLTVRNHREGIIAAHPANWNATVSAFDSTVFTACRTPDKSRVWYRAGLRHRESVLVMDSNWERIVAYYALTMMDRPICQCNSIENVTAHYKTDFALRSSTQAASTQFRITDRLLDNPFGTTLGAVNAWRAVQREALGEAVVNVHA